MTSQKIRDILKDTDVYVSKGGMVIASWHGRHKAIDCLLDAGVAIEIKKGIRGSNVTIEVKNEVCSL